VKFFEKDSVTNLTGAASPNNSSNSTNPINPTNSDDGQQITVNGPAHAENPVCNILPSSGTQLYFKVLLFLPFFDSAS